MRTLKRRPTILTLSFLAALLLVPVSANAATNFGSRLNHDPANSGECATDERGTCTLAALIHPSDPEGDPYAGGAPVDGVITKSASAPTWTKCQPRSPSGSRRSLSQTRATRRKH